MMASMGLDKALEEEGKGDKDAEKGTKDWREKMDLLKTAAALEVLETL